MSHHIAVRPPNTMLRAHLVLGLVLLAGGVTLAIWPSAGIAVGLIAAASVAVHLGAAVLVWTGILWLWARVRRDAQTGLGATIRWAFRYDLLVWTLTFGREGAMREATLERARVSTGERVLDVGCGTGTLAIAAKRRVGPQGAVRGVDAAAEMVARAKRKAVREGIDVVFDIAPAQVLPFPDGAFDVVLCTLVMHHLPEDGRRQALAEMRRVLRPEGRLLVDIAEGRGVWAALNPVLLLHGHDARHVLPESEEALRKTGFSDVAAGPLGFGILGFTLGRAKACDA